MRMILNLLTNAVKYSKEKGEEERWVRLQLSRTKKKAVVTVEDNGIGIKEEELGTYLPEIFIKLTKPEAEKTTASAWVFPWSNGSQRLITARYGQKRLRHRQSIHHSSASSAYCR